MRYITLFFIFYLSIFVFGKTSAFACKYEAEVRTEAEKAGLPANVVVALMKAESSCREQIVGPGGERGLFQFTKSTWKKFSNLPFDKAFDPHENIKAGIKHLKEAGTTDPKGIASWHNAGTEKWWKLQKKWSINHPNKIYRAIYRGEIS